MPTYPDPGWHTHHAQYLGRVDPFWNQSDILGLDWRDIDVQREVTGISRAGAREQNQWHQTWISAEASRHRMAFGVDQYFAHPDVLALLPQGHHSFTVIEVAGGRMLPWHQDYYSNHVSLFQIPETRAHKIRRALLCIQDWSYGQVIQIGDDFLHHWQAGALYSWQHDTWHGAANFGDQAMRFVQITYDTADHE